MEIHPSCPVASVGGIPPTLGNLRQHHHACSSSQRRAHHCLIEEQWGNKDDSTLASPQSSPEPVCGVKGDPRPEASEAQPKMVPLGFREIAQSLTEDESPRARINSPLGSVSPGLLAGSAVATMMSTELH